MTIIKICPECGEPLDMVNCHMADCQVEHHQPCQICHPGDRMVTDNGHWLITPRFIVAEVSVTWPHDKHKPPDIIARRFERVIETNRKRDYRLLQFVLNQVIPEPGCMVETIVAVFEKDGP